MLLARLAEERIANLYRGGKITGGVFLGKGQEALSAATGMALREGDIFAPLIRDQAGRFAFGEDLLDFTRTYLGSRLGPMRGRDGNIHRGRPGEGHYAMISHLGAMIPTVAGALMARRFRGETSVVGVTCIGDGGTSTGAFHEGVNLAAVERLPLVVVVASLLRLVGHGEHDDGQYIDPALRESALGRDCLALAEQRLLDLGWADAVTLAQWRDETTHQIEEAVETTLREPLPDPNTETWCALATPHLRDGFLPE